MLTDLFYEGFFHWFGDIIPKVEALLQRNTDLREHMILIPASRYAPYVEHSLEAYGVRHYVIPAGQYVEADEVCFIPRLAPTGNYRPELMAGIRQRMRNRFAGGDRDIRLYIARKDAPKRRLLNEDDLLPILERHGFESVSMERMPFAEQVRLATQCSAIVGLHGAGLTHMLWARVGTRVLEIRGADESRNNCYYSLASDLGYSYYYVPAKQQSPFRPSYLSDYVVDVQRFQAVLSQVVSVD